MTDVLRRLLACVLAAYALTVLPARATDIWFGPRGPEIGGSPDWNQLFKDSPAWNSVANRQNVFAFTAAYVLQTPDATLQAMAANLRSHHIALGLGAQSVATTPADSCGHTEGYAPVAENRAAADKLVRLGLRLDILTLDGPVWFGHYATGPQECGFTIDQVTDRTVATARPFLDRFPDLAIGDVEGLPVLVMQPDWRANYEAFLAGFATRLGRSITFVQTDDNWQTPDIDTTIAAFAAFTRGHGLKFAVIYDGDTDDKTDAGWVASAIEHFTRLESIGGVIPDQAVFDNWTQHPTNILPETDPAAFSHVIEVYQRSRVQLAAERRPDRVQGRLLDARGTPVAQARLSVAVIGSAPDRPPPVHVISGIVPPNARSALLGMRINMECNCAGPNDLVIGDIVYTETDAQGARTTGSGSDANASRVQVYSLPQQALKLRGRLWEDAVRVWPVATAEGGLVARVVAKPGQHADFGSDDFPVTPGAAYTLRAPIGAVDGGGMFGLAMVLWFDADRHGLYRDDITLVRDTTEMAHGVTDVDGRFMIPLPGATGLAGRRLAVTAEATATSRGAILELPGLEQR